MCGNIRESLTCVGIALMPTRVRLETESLKLRGPMLLAS